MYTAKAGGPQRKYIDLIADNIRHYTLYAHMKTAWIWLAIAAVAAFVGALLYWWKTRPRTKQPHRTLTMELLRKFEEEEKKEETKTRLPRRRVTWPIREFKAKEEAAEERARLQERIDEIRRRREAALKVWRARMENR